jgi:lipid II:glycine glycyltransferase (peptidoglycan interpeptide bridge formation enzyme)
MCDRGPLWFDGFGTPAHIEAFFQAYKKEFPARWLRRRRVIPEIESHAEFEQMLNQLGYKKQPSKGYQTIWLDLTLPVEVLRSNLNGKWRNMLNKAEKSGVSIEWDSAGRDFPWLLKNYQIDKTVRGFEGADVGFLKCIAEAFIKNGEDKSSMLTAKAELGGKNIAGILLFLHGSSATYQLGWISAEGKNYAAHNLLLFEALKHLKNHGIMSLDLGGINDDSAKGVKKFKEGMGGQSASYAGLYI